MTVEERLAALEGKFGKIDKIIGDQNSYITNLENRKKQLEAEVKAGTVQPQAQPQPQVQPQQRTAPVNKPYEEYQRRVWRESVVNETLAKIQNVNPAHKSTIDEEVRAYCKENMQDSTTTDKYVRSVFEMLYGRALTNPSHAIHTAQVVQQAAPQQPAAQPQTTPQPEQATQPQPVPSDAQFNQAFPPVVGQSGQQTFVPGAPVPEPEKKIRSVADAMAVLKEDL